VKISIEFTQTIKVTKLMKLWFQLSKWITKVNSIKLQYAEMMDHFIFIKTDYWSQTLIGVLAPVQQSYLGWNQTQIYVQHPHSLQESQPIYQTKLIQTVVSLAIYENEWKIKLKEIATQRNSWNFDGIKLIMSLESWRTNSWVSCEYMVFLSL
jgi:hypothetical protein